MTLLRQTRSASFQQPARAFMGEQVSAKRRMISLSMGSCTVSAASFAESHFTSRCSFSGHCLLCRVTFSGKTYTSETTTTPLLRRFLYGNDPTERLPTAPTTPASSKASRAAEWQGALPYCGQPFGMIQRCVSRDVTSMTSGRDLPVNL
jgi:hypothetical protein